MGSRKSWKREVALVSLAYTLGIFGWAVWFESQMAFDVAQALMPFATGMVMGAYGLEGWRQLKGGE